MEQSLGHFVPIRCQTVESPSRSCRSSRVRHRDRSLWPRQPPADFALCSLNPRRSSCFV
jgi:hypothetical protein